jgi:hypothetical protein
MAQHYWVRQRAQSLQDHYLDDKNLALYLRYQTANDRGFSKSSATFSSSAPSAARKWKTAASKFAKMRKTNANRSLTTLGFVP